MGIKNFIESVKAFLELNEFQKVGKKKSIKKLLKALELKEEDLLKTLKTTIDEEKQKQIEEDLALTSIHIKNGKELLEKLNSK